MIRQYSGTIYSTLFDRKGTDAEKEEIREAGLVSFANDLDPTVFGIQIHIRWPSRPVSVFRSTDPGTANQSIETCTGTQVMEWIRTNYSDSFGTGTYPKHWDPDLFF